MRVNIADASIDGEADDNSARNSRGDINSADDEAHVNSILMGSHIILQTTVQDPSEEDGKVMIGIPIINQASEKTNEIYHDSGANRHVFWDRSVFSAYREIPPIRVCAFGDNMAAMAIGKGSVTLKGSLRGEIRTFTLNNVLHIPAARSNLVSQSQLDKRGVGAYFGGGGKLMLTMAGNDIISGALRGDLYRLDITPVVNPSDSIDPQILAVPNSTQPGFCTA